MVSAACSTCSARHIGQVDELVEALNVLTKDYAAWIAEQRARVGKDVVGYDASAKASPGSVPGPSRRACSRASTR
jgi:hypothetical protein